MTEPTDDAPRPSARDLVRRRTRPKAPDTGRRHHIGAAPQAVPVHTDEGVGYARATAWQLADRTPSQLQAQRATTDHQMREAAAALDFERAAHLRDELAALDAELAARG